MKTGKPVEFEPKTNIGMDYKLNKLRSIFDKQGIMKIITKIILSIIGYCDTICLFVLGFLWGFFLLFFKIEYTSNYQNSNSIKLFPRK